MKHKVSVFYALLKKYDVPAPVTEHKFLDNRRFRFDYAWLDSKIALEVEGGVWTGGRHIRPRGFLKDMEKYNLAAIAGWEVLRTTPNDLCTIRTVKLIQTAINQREVHGTSD